MDIGGLIDLLKDGVFEASQKKSILFKKSPRGL